MRVVRLKPYLRAMRKMGLDEPEMALIEAAILAAPERHPVIRGLKGVRKARFARPGGGKSGGGRVIYCVAIGQKVLAMLTAYAKNQKENLTPDDRRAILQALDNLLERGR